MDNAGKTVIYYECPICGDPKSGGCSCLLQQSPPQVGNKTEKTPTSTTCSGTSNTSCPPMPTNCSVTGCKNTLLFQCKKNTLDKYICGFCFCSTGCDDNHFHKTLEDHNKKY